MGRNKADKLGLAAAERKANKASIAANWLLPGVGPYNQGLGNAKSDAELAAIQDLYERMDMTKKAADSWDPNYLDIAGTKWAFNADPEMAALKKKLTKFY